jgi:hypothetical protein
MPRIRAIQRRAVPAETLYDIIMFYTGGRYRGYDIDTEQLMWLCSQQFIREHKSSKLLEDVWNDIQNASGTAIDIDLATRTYRRERAFENHPNPNLGDIIPTGIDIGVMSVPTRRRWLRIYGRIKQSKIWQGCFTSRGLRSYVVPGHP